jgi:hypothetical protein
MLLLKFLDKLSCIRHKFVQEKSMKHSIKIITFLAAIYVLLISFSGCAADRHAIISREENPSIAETLKPVETDNAKSEDEISNRGEELSYETLMLAVNSSPVYWPEFHFWLNYIEKYYWNYHPDAIANWNSEKNGMSLSDFFFSCAVGYACKDRAIEARAKELGIELSVKDLAEIEKKRKSNIEIYGSELEYLRIVSSMYVTEDVFNYLTRIDYLGDYLFKSLYGASGEKCSDEEVMTFVEKQGFGCAKYIFLSNTDADGNNLGAEKQAENNRLIGDMLGRLRASAEPLTLFKELMNKYGKDMNASNYPDGRLFVSGGMGEEFESAYSKLKENEYSGLVETEQGCYIILRSPIFPDMAVDSSGSTLRYMTAYDYLFKKQIEDLGAKMEIKYEDAYYKLKASGFSGN